MTENIERVIKVETDFFDGYTWESRVDITKVEDRLNSSEVPLNNQVFIIIYLVFSTLNNCVLKDIVWQP